MTRRRAPRLLLTAALALAPALSLADVIPPDVDACRGASAGARCGGSMGVPAGACVQGTCTRLDYARWDRDAMSMPPTVTEPCLRCTAGGADASPADAATPADAPTAADAGRATTPAATSGGCAVSLRDVGGGAGPLGLAALAWFALLGRRRGDR